MIPKNDLKKTLWSPWFIRVYTKLVQRFNLLILSARQNLTSIDIHDKQTYVTNTYVNGLWPTAADPGFEKGGGTGGSGAAPPKIFSIFRVKVQVFYSLISSLKTYHHFNSPGSIQSCSRFGALNSSYTLPSLPYQALIFTWVKWSIWGWSVLPKDTPS